MISWILNLATIVGTQLFGVLGIFFLFGFILSKIETLTLRIYRDSIGWKGILWTAWLGTPIHEFSHIIIAKIFRHKIERFSLFEPNEDTGDLGYVDHSFNRYSLYQRVGNFFIGAAPLIFGSFFLMILVYFFVPNGKNIFMPFYYLSHTPTLLENIYIAIRTTLIYLFTTENLRSWNFWLFLYFSFCIVSHMAPSKKDRSGMWGGLGWIIIILTIVNGISLALHRNITEYILKINQYLGIVTGMYVYAILLALIHLVFASIFLWPFKKK